MTAPSLPQLLVSHWQPAWPLDVMAMVLFLLYVGAGARTHGGWPRRRTAAFAGGVGCVVLALQSGVGAYDDRLLSIHMVQHMLLLLLAPLLLLVADPLTLVLVGLPPRARPRPARLLRRLRGMARPIPCLALFDVIIVGTHLPGFYDSTLRHPLFHEVEHALYLVAGFALWWPIIGPDPVRSRRLGGLGRLLYMLASMPAMALIGAYLNRHSGLVYAPYARPAQTLGISALADQAQAGAIMWVAGSVLMTVIGIWAALSSLVAEERSQRLADARASQLGAR